MTILTKPISTGITVDLTGPEGNAFNLIGLGRNLARQMGLDPKAITEEMISGDYEQLVATFDSYFGTIVTLYR